MKLSAQEEYGLRCLLSMARHGVHKSVTIPELAQAEGLTVSLVGKIMRFLRKGGFVKSVRGKSGGYTLSRPLEEILIGDVLSFMGGRMFDPGFCSRHAGGDHLCHHTSDCSIRSLLNVLQQVIDGVLSRITLHDLLRGETQLKDWMNEETPKKLRLISEKRPA